MGELTKELNLELEAEYWIRLQIPAVQSDISLFQSPKSYCQSKKPVLGIHESGVSWPFFLTIGPMSQRKCSWK